MVLVKTSFAIDELTKSAGSITFRKSRDQNIATGKIMRNLSNTVAQAAQRLLQGSGSKFLPAIRRKGNGATVDSPAYTQLKTRLVLPETWTSPFAREYNGAFDEVKAYVANPANSAVVSAFATTAGKLQILDFSVSPTGDIVSAAQIAICAYIALANNRTPGLTHTLANLVAADAQALEVAVGHAA